MSAKPDLSAYKILVDGTLQEIPSDKIVDNLISLNVIVFHLISLKYLVVWIGKRAPKDTRMYIARSEKSILAKSKDYTILRHFTVEQPKENDEFFYMVGVSRNDYDKRQQDWESYLNGFYSEIRKLETEKNTALKAADFDKTSEIANQIIEEAKKVNDVDLIDLQKKFIASLDKEKDLMKKRNEADEKITALSNQLTPLVQEEKGFEAHKIAQEIRDYLQLTKKPPSDSVKELLDREDVLYRESMSKEEDIIERLRPIERALLNDLKSGSIESAKTRLVKAKTIYSLSKEPDLIQRWKAYEDNILKKDTEQQKVTQERDQKEKGIQTDLESIKAQIETKIAEKLFDEALKLMHQYKDMGDKSPSKQVRVQVLTNVTRFKERMDNSLRQDEELIHIKELMKKSEGLESKGQLGDAMDPLARSLGLAQMNHMKELSAEIEIKLTVLSQKKVAYDKKVETINTLHRKVKEDESQHKYQAVIDYCNQIIQIAQEIGQKDVVDKHQPILLKAQENLGSKQKEADIQVIINQSDQKVQIFAYDDALNELNKALTIARTDKIEGKIPAIEAKIAQINQSKEEFAKNQTELQRHIDEETTHESANKWVEAIANCDFILNTAAKVGKNDLIPKYTEIRKKLLERSSEQERQLNFFNRLNAAIQKNQELQQWETGIQNCKKIIEIAPKAEKESEIPKYSQLIKEFQDKLAEVQKAAEAEKVHLSQNMKLLESVISVENNVLPQIEEFKVEDVIGNLSTDVDQMINQLEGLLEKQRVEVKTEATSKSVIKSASGEVLEIQKTNKITETQAAAPSGVTNIAPTMTPVKFNLQSGITNPFDDIIEEAILSDVIPYNFEITEVFLNGEKPAEQPSTEMTKDGLQFQWTLKNIAPKQEVNITYDLRKRVSRTIILPLEQQVKVIKTHTNLNPMQLAGLFDAKMTFANSFKANVKGVVIEDIIPMNYIFQIRAPDKDSHADATETAGTLVKWNLKNVEDGASTLHEYLLLELYRFEELKIQTHMMCETAFNDLKQADLKTSAEKYGQIVQVLNDYK